MPMSVHPADAPARTPTASAPPWGAAAAAGVAQQPCATPWLVADIGGTNARFGWVASPGAPIEHVQTLRCAEHAGPAEAAQAYLAPLAAKLGAQWQAPRAAAFAVATAVGADRVAFTNSGWAFSRRETAQALALDELLLLNDFAALALSLPTLAPAQLRVQGSWPEQPATLAVVGPGTGLGVAALVPTAHGWVPVPGEGGHVTLASADSEERALLDAALRLMAEDAGQPAHVSAERLLSGIGLPLLHRATAAVLGTAVSPLATPEIVQQGLAGDLVCSRTLDHFCALLGGFAGNVALTTGARGGVFIGGGIVPRLGDRFFASRFRERFEAKGRFAAYLGAIPTAVILDTHTALAGAAAALAQVGH
jgi:glucokinase